MDRLGRIRRITVHHEGNRPFTATSIAECRARIVNVLNGERGVGHRDIAYHYVIDPAGRVWEARDIRWEGRHTRNNHSGNLGVVCLGNFEEQSIPPAQLAALERFLRDLQKKHKIGRKQIFTHQELSPTLCPGKDLQRKMGPLRARLA
jgi:N-acetyl-anhydromuramyl-L-alanine amidase AmpD